MRRLLVVEDDPRLLRALTISLRRAGFEVATARDGDEAVVSLAAQIPDLVVSDVMMPGADGLTLAKYIRADPRTDIIPIIFLTAKDTRADRVNGFRAGVDAYITKPFEPDELVAVITSILDRVQRTHARIARRPVASASSAPNGEPIPALVPDADLTETERRVSEAVARGLSNKEIAAEFGVSARTIEMHISHILAKKGWSNRVEIARDVLRRGSL